MDKLKMQSLDVIGSNIKKIQKLFPNCVTERLNKDGKPELAIDFEKLQAELSNEIIGEGEERYQFTWPDKRAANRLANTPTTMTLRPCREESVDFDHTQNLYIEGDNLDVLKALRETYLSKVKMIYIDPPYNTGNDFVYNDDFAQSRGEFEETSGLFDEEGNQTIDPMQRNTESNGRFHTDWLNMIYPRLKVARDLLSDDGVIFISIDDNEVENLKKIGNEVFGIQNFVGMLSVENNPKGRKNSSFISISSEYCIIYAKNKSVSYFIENVPKQASDMTLDENGRYVHNSGKRVLVGENSFNNKVSKVESDKNYSVYYRANDNSLITKKEKIDDIDDTLISIGYRKYNSFYKNSLVENTYTDSKLKELHKLQALEFSNDKIYEKNFSDTIRIKSLLVNREYEAIVHGCKQKYSMELTTTGAGTILKSLFELKDIIFTAPKNPGFLKLLISLIDSTNFTILDFFSGSATTAHAVMQLNAEDGGNRKFIMVQLPEKTDEKSEAYKAGYKNICEIGKERIRRAGKKIKEDNKDKEGIEKLDTGFRVLKLDSSNMEDVYYTPQEFTMQSLFNENVKADRTGEDLLFQVMLDLGIELSAKIETQQIAGKTVYLVDDNYLIACFDRDVTEAAITEIAKLHPIYFVMRDASAANDNVIDNFEQLFEVYSKDTVRKIL